MFIKKMFAICVFLCLDLILFVWIYTYKNEETLTVSTTYYENVVAITFDDGPHSVYTEELLDGLKERGVKASFFVVGQRIPGNEDLIKRMHDEGHLIGNHTYSHVQLDSINSVTACEEVEKTNAVIEKITGEAVEYIRPPYGLYDLELECSIDLSKVLWTVDPRDWDTTDVNKIVESVVNCVKDRDIILMHDIYPTSVSAALAIIDKLQDRGFVFVTVDELMVK